MPRRKSGNKTLHGKPIGKIHEVHGQVIIEHRSFKPVIDDLSERLSNPKYFESLPHGSDPADPGRYNSTIRVVQIGKRK